MSCAACSSKNSDNPRAPFVQASNVTLTAAQRQNVRLFTVEPSKFRKTIEATGAVDFDNDQATSVLAPFGVRCRGCWFPSATRSRKATPWRRSPRLTLRQPSAPISKALATAKTDRRLADLDKDLIQHHGVAQREAEQAETDALNAEADRDAALQGLIVTERPSADHQGLFRKAGRFRAPRD